MSSRAALPAAPLDGIRVGSLAEQYPGPYATLLLADMGADVILVERPVGGDPARAFPELFDALNRNGAQPQGVLPEPAHGVFLAKDAKPIALGIAHEDTFWAALCDATGLADVRAITDCERRARTDELSSRLRDVLRTRPRAEWLSLFARRGIPSSAVRELEEVVSDEQLRARDPLVSSAASESTASRRDIRQPLTFQGHTLRSVRAAPVLGEHTAEVLAGLAERADPNHPTTQND